jgi:hypothetical protein
MKISISAAIFTAAISIAAQPIFPPSPAPSPRLRLPVFMPEGAMQGDGRCPIDAASDPDCARSQPYKPIKSKVELTISSSRDQYPPRDRMGGGTPPGPDGNGPRIPPARRGGFTRECNFMHS